jgi:hypothetical protein
MIEAGDALEDKLSEIAHDGNVTGAIFLLKALRPDKYKDHKMIGRYGTPRRQS